MRQKAAGLGEIGERQPQAAGVFVVEARRRWVLRHLLQRDCPAGVGQILGHLRIMARARRWLPRGRARERRLGHDAGALLLQNALHAFDRVALAIEQMAYGLNERDILRAIKTPPAGALDRGDLLEARFPKAQHMRRQIETLGDLADRLKGLYVLGRVFAHFWHLTGGAPLLNPCAEKAPAGARGNMDKRAALELSVFSASFAHPLSLGEPMEDLITFPHATPIVSARPTHENALAVRNWLWAVAALVFLMVFVGGATRLTESGLSITQWKPVTGVIPPLTQKEWLEAFEEYKKIPQYKELFPDMNLAGFQVIYAWEWVHRLLGRLVGLVFAGGFAWFWIRKQIPARLTPKLLAIFGLGALQGFIGWWMVSSGLSGRVEVAQERLAIHLLMAALIFSLSLWVAGGLGKRGFSHVERGRARLRVTSVLILGLVFVQLGAGALVAGLRAGLVDNTWPLMDGALVPPGDVLWNLSPWWVNFLDNPIAVQFTHRMIAYGIFALALVHLVDAALNTTGKVRRGAFIVFGHVAMQIMLGVATLLLVGEGWMGTPHILLALAHQAVAFGVLAVATLHARRLAQAPVI